MAFIEIERQPQNKVVQWNLAIPTILGTDKSGWISEVAGSQGKF